MPILQKPSALFSNTNSGSRNTGHGFQSPLFLGRGQETMQGISIKEIEGMATRGKHCRSVSQKTCFWLWPKKRESLIGAQGIRYIFTTTTSVVDNTLAGQICVNQGSLRAICADYCSDPDAGMHNMFSFADLVGNEMTVLEAGRFEPWENISQVREVVLRPVRPLVNLQRPESNCVCPAIVEWFIFRFVTQTQSRSCLSHWLFE